MNIENFVLSVVKKWGRDNLSQKAIEESVLGILEKNKKDVIVRQLGLTYRWDQWEVDSCNGRISTIDAWIRQCSDAVIREWLIKTIGEPIVLTEKQKSAIRKEYRETLSANLREEVHERARRDANVIASDLIKEALSSLDVTQIGIKNGPRAYEYDEEGEDVLFRLDEQ